MTNNHHAVGVIGGITSPSVNNGAPSMAMAFQKNGPGSKNPSGMGGNFNQGKPIQGQHIPGQNNFINRKKISTQ